jgi:hypothetical protein
VKNDVFSCFLHICVLLKHDYYFLRILKTRQSVKNTTSDTRITSYVILCGLILRSPETQTSDFFTVLSVFTRFWPILVIFTWFFVFFRVFTYFQYFQKTVHFSVTIEHKLCIYRITCLSILCTFYTKKHKSVQNTHFSVLVFFDHFHDILGYF